MPSLRAVLVASSIFLLTTASPLSTPPTLLKRYPPAPAPTLAGPELNDANFPDPAITWSNGAWYSFATNSGGVNIQVATSKDFFSWEFVTNPDGTHKDALPSAPAWVNMTAENTWAPDISELDDGTFVMYFSASALVSSTHHCVGAALSNSITGPYIPQAKPLACPLAQGGAIDAAGFKDWVSKGAGWGGNDGWGFQTGSNGWQEPHNSWNNSQWCRGGKGGNRYVVYKVDGNSIGHGGPCGNTVAPIVPTPIMLQEVAADGITTIGSPLTILNNNGASDDGIVEAPSLVKTASGQYVLFFSSGCYADGTYTVNYATSTSIAGPYTRYGPLLQTGDYGLTAPGGASIFWDAEHIVFHADHPTVSDRTLYVGLVNITTNHVTI